jgi:hypothetical protein
MFLEKLHCLRAVVSGRPKDFPQYSTVHTFFRRYKLQGIGEKTVLDLVKKTGCESEGTNRQALA